MNTKKNDKRNKLRASRKLLNLCTECGKQREVGRTKCLLCLAKHNILSSKTTKKYISEGKCCCGRQKEQHKYRCPICQERNRLHSIKLRKNRKANNLCTRCGKPLLERTDVTKCTNCIEGSIEFTW